MALSNFVHFVNFRKYNRGCRLRIDSVCPSGGSGGASTSVISILTNHRPVSPGAAQGFGLVFPEAYRKLDIEVLKHPMITENDHGDPL
jgi:hypothetical protein